MLTYFPGLFRGSSVPGIAIARPVGSCENVYQVVGHGTTAHGIYYIQYNTTSIIKLLCDFSVFSNSGATMILKVSKTTVATPYPLIANRLHVSL